MVVIDWHNSLSGRTGNQMCCGCLSSHCRQWAWDPGTWAVSAIHALTDRYTDISRSSGILSQFNLGKPNTQIAQFFICLAPCPHFDGKYAAFGKVIEGMEIVRKAGEWGSASGQPSKKVEIADCGEVAIESGAAVSTSSPVPAAAASAPASAPASAAKATGPTAAKASEPAPGIWWHCTCSA